MTLDPMQIAVSLLLFGAVFLLIWSLFRFPVGPEPPLHRRVALAMGAYQRATVFEWVPLAPVMSLALAAAGRLSFKGLRDMVRRGLDASGNPHNYSIDEYLAIAMVCGAAVGLFAGLIAMALLGQLDPLVIFVMGLAGFGIPLYALHNAAAQRVMRISKRLPYTLDLIALTMAAGSTFSEAIETIIRDDPNDDFNQELRLVQAEIEFGSPRALALANMARRIPLETLRSVVGAVNQAESLGTPLAAILMSQSGMLRMRRSVRAEKLSASASLRILAPSMLILMAVVVVVFGPIIVSYIDGRLWLP